MEKAGKVKVASATSMRNVYVRSDDCVDTDDLHRAGARLHAIRSGGAQRPRHLALHGGAALLQVSTIPSSVQKPRSSSVCMLRCKRLKPGVFAVCMARRTFRGW
jgi:hypothetical protein